jgi:hypothetical protein
MRVLLLPLFVALSLSPARADRMVLIREEHNAPNRVLVIVTRHYTQGSNSRWEDESPDVALNEGATQPAGRAHRAYIANEARGSVFVLDMKAAQYAIEPRRRDAISALASMIQRPPAVHLSGKTVNVYFETVDTGERRRILGQQASHLLLHERRIAEPGACSGNSSVETDGWYIPATQPGDTIRARLMVRGGIECRDTIVVHGKDVSPGFALLETTVRRSPGFRRSEGRKFSTRREVLEFSEQPLDPGLFQPAQGFERVDYLPGEQPVPWTRQLTASWRELKTAAASWFQ